MGQRCGSQSSQDAAPLLRRCGPAGWLPLVSGMDRQDHRAGHGSLRHHPVVWLRRQEGKAQAIVVRIDEVVRPARARPIADDRRKRVMSLPPQCV